MDSAPSQPVPVFPLPDLVLFPRTTVPLHVFELRYRTMVRDALSRGRVLALALLEPGYDLDYHGSPAFHELGCLASIDQVEWLPDDRYNLLVRGLARVRFAGIEREFPYRAARVVPVEEHPYPEDDPIVQIDKRALLDVLQRMREHVRAAAGGETVDLLPTLGPGDPYARVVNTLCMMCGAPATERLALLSEDSVIERGRRVRETLERRLRQPDERPGEGGESN